MCHIINPSKFDTILQNQILLKAFILHSYQNEAGHSYYDLLLSLPKNLIGIKEFRYEEGALYSIYQFPNRTNPYKYKFNTKNRLIISQISSEEQKVKFNLQYVDKYVNEINLYGISEDTIERKIIAGYHISPFDFEIINNKLKVINFKFICLEDKEVFTINLPVMFNTKDVLFYDGVNVSVNKFSLLTPKEFGKFARKLELKKTAVKRYKTIYNELLNRKRKK